jgi:hypothetical protein
MSRNLCRTDCVFCDGVVRTAETPRPITRFEPGAHFSMFEGMLVAKAACVDCEAPYLAWVDESTCARPSTYPRRAAAGESHFDLSHYHAFNDEPVEADLPKYRIQVVRQRLPWPACYVCARPTWHDRCRDHRCPGWAGPSERT